MASSDAQKQASLERMIAEMSKTDVKEAEQGYTLGWDMVVSYSEKEINQNLARKWEKAREDTTRNMLTTIDIHQNSYDDETGTQKYSWRTMELGPPRIEFEGAAVMEPAVHLILPVESIYYQKSNKQKDKIGERKRQLDVLKPFDVKLSGIKLGSVTGKYETVMKPKQDGKVSSVDTLPVPIESSKKTVVFRDDGSKPTTDDFENAWVVLDFPMEGAALNLDLSCNVVQRYAEDEIYEQALGQMNALRGALNSYFKEGPARIDVLEYALATVKNVPEYNGAVTADLTPASFRFATFKSTSGGSAVLSLFIHTLSGTDSGTRDDLQALWIGSWAEHKISPIPAGYTASIIINPHLAYGAMLRPGLEKDGNFKVESLEDNKEGGISFSAKYQPSWRVGGTYYDYEGKVYECRLWIDGWDKDLKNNSVHFKLYQRDSSSAPIAKIDWEFDVDNKWTDMSRNERIEAFGKHIKFMEETLRTSYKLHKELDLSIQVTDNNFSFEIDTSNLHSMWDMSTGPREAEGNWFDKLSTAMNNFVSPTPPDDIQKKREEWMKSLRPSIKFNAVGLGFFLTTNLLHPGAKVIQLDPKVLRIPRDLVLVGEIVQGTDSIKEAAQS